MKLLVDMNLSPRWIEFFHHKDIFAVHWSTVGAVYAPDVEIMAYAASNNLVILTHDLDLPIAESRA